MRGAHLDEGVRLDANGKGPHVYEPPLELDAVRHSGQTEDAGARREEVSGVVVRVEPDEIAVQDTK
jgi:hypothetical protein